MSPSALLPEGAYTATPKEGAPREKSPLDWLPTPDEEKGAVGETFTFSKKQKWVELDSVCIYVCMHVRMYVLDLLIFVDISVLVSVSVSGGDCHLVMPLTYRVTYVRTHVVSKCYFHKQNSGLSV